MLWKACRDRGPHRADQEGRRTFGRQEPAEPLLVMPFEEVNRGWVEVREEGVHLLKIIQQ